MAKTSRSKKTKETSSSQNSKRGTRGPYAKIPANKRANIIRQFLASRASIREIAKVNRLAESSVRNIIKTYREDNRIEPKQRGGVRVESLIDENVSEFIHQTIVNSTSMTLQQLKDAIAQEFNGLDISLTTIHRHCQEKIVFTLKYIDPMPETRDDEYTLEARRQFAIELSGRQSFYIFNCIFIDVADFYTSQIRKFGHSRKDYASINIVDSSRNSNISVIAAISYLGVEQIHASIIEEDNASSTFISFLKALMKKLEAKVLQQCIIIDNSPLLNSPPVKAWIEDYYKNNSTNHAIKFLPPYSPLLNPVKQFFLKMTSYIKKKDLTMNNDILDRVTKAGELVTKKDCEEWVSQSSALLNRCTELDFNV